jgi:chromosomal replication initiation ATPase DnaA
MARLRWHPDELAFLCECSAAGITSEKVARLLDRTQEAVGAKRRYQMIKLWKKPQPPVEQRAAQPVGDIQQAVAAHFDIPVESMRSDERGREFSRPRQVAMFLARKSGQNFTAIGRRFGGRDHTTVIHAVRTIERLMATDPTLNEAITSLSIVDNSHFSAFAGLPASA